MCGITKLLPFACKSRLFSLSLFPFASSAVGKICSNESELFNNDALFPFCLGVSGVTDSVKTVNNFSAHCNSQLWCAVAVFIIFAKNI